MTKNQYRTKVESELVNDFIKKFTEKIGYSPIVVTESGPSVTDYKLLSLAELEECFEPFLPVIYEKTRKLKPKCRYREIMELRHMFCFIGKLMKHTYTDIGRYLNRDHTTVINSVKTFRNLYQTEDAFKMKYLKIINYIKKKYESSAMENLDKV